MTEAEWQACEDVRAMLRHLRGVASERKLRLLALAWVRAALATEECRRFGPLLDILLGVAEDANGAAMKQVRERADFVGAWRIPTSRRSAENLFMALTQESAYASAWTVSEQAIDHDVELAVGRHDRWDDAWRRARRCSRAKAAGLVREVFGPPLHPPAAAPSRWQVWCAGEPVRLAAAFYTEQHFDDLPILGDALEEAGCTYTEILTHLRSPGPHVRGCWALDLILGKE